MSKLKMDIRIVGDRALKVRLDRTKRRLRNPKRLNTAMALALIGHYQRNMTRGVDPRGRKLPEVERWTRKHRLGLGAAAARGTKPLVASGGLRRSLGIKAKTHHYVSIGFRGKYEKVAENMVDGKAGWMPVKKKSIRRNPLGGAYLPVVANDGRHFTKRVVGGRVNIHPKRRDFFYLTNRQRRIAKRQANKWLKRNAFR